MSDNKKYYYLKLKENFFESDELIMLESMQDGCMYSNILLKLYLKSLKNNGKLMFNERIPYNSTILANITRHSVAVVEKAIQIFKDLGLIEVLDNGAIYMLDIQNFIGNSSTEADRKRKYRTAIVEEKKTLLGQMSGQMSGKCPDKNPPEKEKEKEIEIEIEKEKNNKKDKSFSFCSYTDNNDLIIALNDFLEMRKQTKSKMTDRAIKLMLNKLDELASNDDDKIKILNQSIMNSWKGLFPLNNKEVFNGTGKQSNSKVNDEVEYETEFYNLTNKPIDDDMFKYKD